MYVCIYIYVYMYVYVCVCMYMYVWPQNCEIYRNLVKISLIRFLLSVWQPSYDILFITFFCYDHYNLFNF